MTVIDEVERPARFKQREGASFFVIAAFFLTGFFVVLSLPLISDGAQSVRFLDLLGIVGVIYLVSVALRNHLHPKVWFVFWVAGTGLLLVFTDALNDSDTGRLNILVRLVFSIATGIFLARMATKYSQVKTLSFGVWCGAVAACLIAYGQSQGISAMIALAPIDRVESAIQGILRPQAIWGHPNAAAQVTMAGAAIILLAWKKRQETTLLPLAMYAVLPIMNYMIMQNRSPLIVGLFICLLMTFRHSQIHLRVAAVLCVACLAAFLIFAPEYLIGDRWTGTFSGLSTSEQVVERLQSTFAGLSIAFEAPLGHALADREARMLAETGIRASHNGYIFAALVIGPWLAFPLFTLLFSVFRKRNNYYFTRHYGVAFGSISIMLLFEDAVFEPTVATLMAFISALAFIEVSNKNVLWNEARKEIGWQTH